MEESSSASEHPLRTISASADPNGDSSGAEVQTSIPLMDGLSPEERTQLLMACVALVGIPADRDALNAVLRLCLRLTQDFDQAVIFTQLGGMKMLLGLTQVWLSSLLVFR